MQVKGKYLVQSQGVTPQPVLPFNLPSICCLDNNDRCCRCHHHHHHFESLLIKTTSGVNRVNYTTPIQCSCTTTTAIVTSYYMLVFDQEAEAWLKRSSETACLAVFFRILNSLKFKKNVLQTLMENQQKFIIHEHLRNTMKKYTSKTISLNISCRRKLEMKPENITWPKN